MQAAQWGNYEIDYAFDGAQWAITVRATSEDDARRRLARAAAFGNVTGPWSRPIAAWHGWLWVPLYVRVRNAFSR